MALEQIIADLDDLEERVENLNVDQKTNEDILLNVLKRVDDTEKDLRKVRGFLHAAECLCLGSTKCLWFFLSCFSPCGFNEPKCNVCSSLLDTEAHITHR